LDFGDDGFAYVNAGDRILRYDAITGAFHDTFVSPEQYALAGPGALFSMTYAAPEPGAPAMLAVACALPLLRWRR
jgi:hypothetical protein